MRKLIVILLIILATNAYTNDIVVMTDAKVIQFRPSAEQRIYYGEAIVFLGKIGGKTIALPVAMNITRYEDIRSYYALKNISLTLYLEYHKSESYYELRGYHP